MQIIFKLLSILVSQTYTTINDGKSIKFLRLNGEIIKNINVHIFIYFSNFEDFNFSSLDVFDIVFTS